MPARRLESYRALQGELDVLARKQDERAWAAKDTVGKDIAKSAKRFFKDHPGKKNR